MMRSTRRDEGFALAALICLISAAAVLTAVMVPLRVMQSRRETEQELIFRGQEYIRAIQKYQRKYGVYPSSIDDLVSRDGYRFIRRQYKDPVTGEDFRLINVNADGSLTGSLTLLSLPVSNQQNGAPGTMPAANGTSPLSGSGGGAGGGNNTQGNTGRNGVQNSANTSGVGTVSGAGGSMGMSSNGGVSGISNPMSGGGTNTNNNSRAGVGGGGVGSGAGTGGAFGGGGATGGGAPGTLAAGAGAFGPMTNPLNGGGNTQTQGNNTANRPGGTTGTGGGNTAAGAPSALSTNAGFAGGGGGGGLGGGGGAAAQISPGVAGVASESTKTAVMIYNEKEKYNEWEFISPLIQNQNQGGNNQPAGNGQQQGTNANRQQGNPPTSPFGGNPIGPTGNPLGGGGGGTGAGNPFGGNAPTTGGTGGARR